MRTRVLIIDDDRAFASIAAAALQREGFDTEMAHALHAAREAMAKRDPEIVILDRRLPDGDGFELYRELRARAPQTMIIIVTAHGDITTAVEAIREGAIDYLVKPVELADLVARTYRAVEGLGLRERLRRAEKELSSQHRMIPPRSAVMQQVVETLERIARASRAPVLLLGETGTGKEVLARHLHSFAGNNAPFVHVNCAAVPHATFESELFGHERGAFTDARGTHRGLVELADQGVLFLDEVGELPPALQAKLLTFLDSGRFRRLGGSEELTSSARIVAATNRDLQQQVTDGSFREDLWFRLSVFRIDVPALRERREDIQALAAGILLQIQEHVGRRDLRLSGAADARLAAYAFPGNVRELRNIIERAAVLEPGPELNLDSVAMPDVAPLPSGQPAFILVGPPLTMQEMEERYARHVLETLGGRRVEAARALGLSYPTFQKRLGEG